MQIELTVIAGDHESYKISVWIYNTEKKVKDFLTEQTNKQAMSLWGVSMRIELHKMIQKH